MAVRRSIGATNSLRPATLLAMGLVLAAIACCAHWLSSIREPARHSPRPSEGAVRRCATTAGLALSGFGLGAMTTAWWAGLTFWTLIVAEETWSWQRDVGARRACDPAPPRGGILKKVRVARRWVRWMTIPAVPTVGDSPTAGAPPTPEADGRVWQRYVRSETDAGEDLVRGTLRVPFSPGARLATAHVAFCPPFAERPQFEVRQNSGPGARLKVAQVLPQGARIEVRLQTPATGGERLELSFTAAGNSADQLTA